MANGLQQFYESFGEFLEELREGVENDKTYEGNDRVRNDNHDYGDEDDDELQALVVDSLKGPMTFILCLFGISCLIFVIEIIVFKFKERRTLRNFVYYP